MTCTVKPAAGLDGVIIHIDGFVEITTCPAHVSACDIHHRGDRALVMAAGIPDGQRLDIRALKVC